MFKSGFLALVIPNVDQPGSQGPLLLGPRGERERERERPWSGHVSFGQMIEGRDLSISKFCRQYFCHLQREAIWKRVTKHFDRHN